MKSRTSFFNAHVLKKDILRFAPVWAVYVIYLVMFVFSGVIVTVRDYDTARIAYSLSRDMGNVNVLYLIYGFGCATLLFGDLFKTRMAGGLHAMPLRRETWFGTHVLAGFLFAAVPNALTALAMSTILGEYAFVAGLWWLVMTTQFLFHFALGVLCVMLSGNLLGHVAVFGTIEFFSMLVYGIYDSVYEPMLYGITTASKPFEFFAPAQWWSYQNWLQWNVQNSEVVAEVYSNEKYVHSVPTLTETKYIYEGIITQEWIYLGVCVVLAVAFLALALVLYRRRKLECAGDFITSKIMGWVFLILGSVCAAVIIPVVGFVIAFFGILMLWERTLKVFRKKNLIAFGITAGCILLTIGLTALDVTGITTKVPEVTEIESVTLNPDWEGNTVLTDVEDIQAVMEAHEYALIDRDPEDGDWYNLELKYTLNDGSTMRRSYTLNADAPALDGIKKIMSRWDIIFDGRDLQTVQNQIYDVSFYVEEYDDEGYYLTSYDATIPPEAWGDLMEAIRQDCQEGTMCQNSVFHEGTLQTLNFRYLEEEEMGNFRHSIHIFEDSTHTRAFLEQYMQ